MKTLTIDDVMAYEPCYPREQVADLFAGRESVTIREICAVDIPHSHRIWLLTRNGVLDPDLRMRWITVIVTRAVTNHALHCGDQDVERWAANWLSGAVHVPEPLGCYNAVSAVFNAARAAAAETSNRVFEAAAYAIIAAAYDAFSLCDAPDTTYASADALVAPVKVAARELQIADLLELLTE